MLISVSKGLIKEVTILFTFLKNCLSKEMNDLVKYELFV